MLKVLMEVFPWDLVDVGIDEVLDCLHGEIGVDGITVPVLTQPVRQLRARTSSNWVFSTKGGLAFPPDADRYARTRLKPHAADWVHQKDIAESLYRACNDRGMSLRIALSAGIAGRMAERHSEMAVKNALDAHCTSNLCLTNPDAQEFVLSALADAVARFRPSQIELTNFDAWWRDADRDDLLGAGAPELLRFFLSICTCESCRQKAG
ncbi:MAG: hypothetical protein ACYTHJ_07345, partial [Planctomycetota bacterium]